MEDTTATQLAVINAKLDVLIEQRHDHEVRLRVLEQARWRWAGITTAAGAVAGVLAPRLLGQ